MGGVISSQETGLKLMGFLRGSQERCQEESCTARDKGRETEMSQVGVSLGDVQDKRHKTVAIKWKTMRPQA